MSLHERESQLHALFDAAHEAGAGRGRTVLVTGEAGIGKTSLVEQFTRQLTERTRVLWGACEALFSPRPLGPLYDIAHTLGGTLRAQLQNEAKPIDVFHGLLDDVRRHDKPSVIVVEDVHWADHATLDFIRFIARRIDQARGLLVLTYRDDEVGSDHPLTVVLGDLPAGSRTWLKLPALSRATVESMAHQAGRSTRDLYRITGGNPFFVTEALRERDTVIASNVREAVLARANRLSRSARDVLDIVSVAPDQLELELVLATHGDDPAALDECVARNLLVLEGRHVAFRHELARMAIEHALRPVRRMQLNRILLAALERIGNDAGTLTRLAHHAIAAGDPDAIVRYVPPAAQAAGARGAHRQAMLLMAAVEPHAERIAPKERARFYDAYSIALFFGEQGAKPIDMSERAARIWGELGDVHARARNLAERCEMIWVLRPPQIRDLRTIAEEAVRLLDGLPACEELTIAYAAASFPVGLDDFAAARFARERAITLARERQSAKARAQAFNWITFAEYQLDGAPDYTHAEELMSASRETGFDRGEFAAYSRFVWHCARTCDLAGMERWCTEALLFGEDRQLDRSIIYHVLERHLAEAAAARGRWREAGARFERLAERPGLPWYMRLVHCRSRSALLAARQGERFDRECLDFPLARETELLMSDRYPLRRAHTEIAWLDRDDEAARRSASELLRIASAWNHPWVLGEAALWNRILGSDEPIPENVAQPYRLQFSGDWRGAAAAWRARGYPYETGLALTLGEEAGQREALDLFETLGANRTADRVRERMREAGLRSVPRGKRASTRDNPAGLTDRELEVLALLAEGLSNADLAQRLHRSVRTVENHVATLIGKLGAASRQQAIAVARERRILDD